MGTRIIPTAEVLGLLTPLDPLFKLLSWANGGHRHKLADHRPDGSTPSFGEFRHSTSTRVFGQTVGDRRPKGAWRKNYFN